MRRDALVILFARGWGSAFGAWKALLVALGLNVVLAVVLAQPVASALHGALDRSTFANRLLKGDVVTFHDHFARSRPGTLGDMSGWDTLATGGDPRGHDFLRAEGAAGAILWTGLAMALLTSLLAAGFAGRFGDDAGRGSLSLFAADVGRYGLSSLALGVLSFAGIVAAYRYVYVASGDLYAAEELRYEWEAILLQLLRLVLFLVVAGLVRLVVLYARASMGNAKSANPFRALARGAGFVARRPARTMALEILFGGVAVLPLLAWLAWGPSWDGADPARLALLLLGQQLVVFFRIAARVAHLGAASSFLKRAEPLPARAAPAAEPAEA